MIQDLVVDAVSTAEKNNTDEVARAAGLVVKSLRADGLVFTAGAGHSLAAVAETFYRAGGLACVYPLYHPELLPLHGARSSTRAERRSGLAAEVLAAKAPGPDDVLVVFSTSGVNPYPVELARAARAAGAPVIAVSSRQSVAAAPRRAGTTLIEEADVVLDTGVRPGDASFPVEEPRTAALSTILNAHLWNSVLAKVVTLAGDTPLWRSSNVEGGDEANASLFARYQPRIPPLG
ncbi:sugar isomerase domain-containing protein [Amycolatopsis alkalitolerans]|uniref:Sugar isomerase domain-containing protein n=1 Tax=Amycolatopsis alkalitolerans TaxID=2547244 RepID=A0A5C4M097_9PSEU|nr:sugar isomerase domain-containing protein [Amycolatopsis alkalitolerans]TNC22995.1 sugar isomerase domain-containing protein [Amycolatopsis alkalitolerans]